MSRLFLRSLLIVLLVVLSAASGARAEPESRVTTWFLYNSDHFIINYTGKDDKFAKEVALKAEDYYRDIADDLGYARTSNFWTWDKRVKIFAYPDHAAFLQGTGQPEWSEGMADYTRKEISSYQGSPSFLDSILPHEMGHLIFRDFVGFKGEVPLWLDEGVAQRCEFAKRGQIKALAKEYRKKNIFLMLDDLMRTDIRMVTSKTRVYIKSVRVKDDQLGILFVSGQSLVNTFYLQAASIVFFLIDKYGSDNFANFCRELRDGKNVEDALRFTYPTQVRTIRDLEDRWREYLEKS